MSSTSQPLTTSAQVSVRLLQEQDLPAVDHILRLAFGTFLGLPDPLTMFGDTDYPGTRWRADPSSALVAEIDQKIVGSNFAGDWGSFGYFGPLSVRPDLWNQGVASRLLDPVVALFRQRGHTNTGLYTFAQSTKHVHLYQKFGFWPRFLTAIMAKPAAAQARPRGADRYSATAEGGREAWLTACRELTEAVYPGLDLGIEIRSVAQQDLGDTLLVSDADRLAAFAICHCGAGSEAGGDTCYVKFGAALPGPGAAGRFEALLAACEAYAAERGLHRLVAGVNLARFEAYQTMLAAGFRARAQGVAMQSANDPGFNRPDVFALDDWR
jgi:GNAT superfamily N-acetyltransferase